MLIKCRICGISSGFTNVQWQLLWLILRLRSGLFSPGASSRRRWRWFPFHARVGLSPWPLPDCHLVRTAIPFLPHKDSLGDFHSGFFRFLSSFANSLSREYRPPAQGHGPRTLSFPFPDLLTQGRLHCTQHFGPYVGDQSFVTSAAPHCRFHPVPLDVHQSLVKCYRHPTVTGLHGKRVGTSCH